MTKIAIISDLHANIDAFNLVLRDIERRNVDQIICLGDLVTKYFYPAEVVDAVKANSSLVIKGNCDDLVANDTRYKFARGKLGLHRIDYLNELPEKSQLIINKVLLKLYHSNPHNLDGMFNPLFDNKNTEYKNNIINDYNDMFTSNNETAVVGHTHQNYLAKENNQNLELINQDKMIIMPNERAIINVGSAGEHNHMEKNANGKDITKIDSYLSYVIIDDYNLKNGGVEAQVIRIPYRETLKQVYFNMVDKQKTGEAPYSPNDTNKVLNSLKDMNYTDEELDSKNVR